MLALTDHIYVWIRTGLSWLAPLSKLRFACCELGYWGKVKGDGNMNKGFGIADKWGWPSWLWRALSLAMPCKALNTQAGPISLHLLLSQNDVTYPFGIICTQAAGGKHTKSHHNSTNHIYHLSLENKLTKEMDNLALSCLPTIRQGDCRCCHTGCSSDPKSIHNITSVIDGTATLVALINWTLP